MARLTAAQVKALREPGMYGDGGTLFLRIAPGGSKQWVQRLTIDGKRRDMGLGGFPLVTLAEAREEAFANRKIARAGGDPLNSKRRKSTMPTFKAAALKVYESKRAAWRNPKTAAKWMRGMETRVFPAIGDKPINHVEQADVLSILVPIWTAKPDAARKLRQSIRAVFGWAQAHGRIKHNPAGEAIDAALPKMPKVKAHHRALPYSEVPAALATVMDGKPTPARLAFKFVVLTAARSGEVREARWSEIDRERRLWIIPAERMKQLAEHRVPLSDAALALLDQAQAFDDGSGLIFPSPLRPGKAQSDMTLTKLLRDHGLADRATVHGMRSSFRDWCADTGKPREVAEAALAHVVGGVEGAYFRSDLLDQRRRVMDGWAAFLSGESAKVVALHG